MATVFCRSSFWILPLVLAPASLAPQSTVSSAKYIRSGTVAICIPDHGCTRETIDGEAYDVIQTPEATMKVAMSRDHTYNRADVIVENHLGSKVRLSLSEFRIEVIEPKEHRLAYVGPQNVRIPIPKKERVGYQRLGTPPGTLTSRVLPASGEAKGHVFFEHSHTATDMAVILPFAGYIFEFPFSVKHPPAAPEAPAATVVSAAPAPTEPVPPAAVEPAPAEPTPPAAKPATPAQ